MSSFTIPTNTVIDAHASVANLAPWLRPGLFAYIVGAHVSALTPVASRLLAERNAILDEAGARYPDVYADDASDGSYKKGDPHPQAGQVVRTDLGNGRFVVSYRDKAAGEEYVRRVAELMSGETTLIVDERLTYEHIKNLDKERLEKPRSINSTPPTEMVVDFASLMVLIERKEYDTNGVAVPATPGSNDVHRVASLMQEP